MKRISSFILLILLVTIPFAHADIAAFENLSLSQNSYWNGSDGAGMFTSGDAVFMNGYDSQYKSWDGWAYSNMTDTTTPGHTNQFSAVTGSGVHGSANYGVAYNAGSYGTASPPNLSFGAVTGNDYDKVISGAFFTNTTYAYLSMLNGDSFAKKFGGTTGNDPDWFKLSIKGITAAGTYTDPIDFYLADYRFSDNSKDYIVNQWTWVDLSGLGKVAGLEFNLSSSDNNSYGMLTPAYFAMDDLNSVPVPAAVWLFGAGLAGILGLRRKKLTGI